MRKQIYMLPILLMTLFFGTVNAQENVIDEVIWVVGDEAILKSQVEEQRMRMQYEGERINGDPYCVIPEQMAIQKLFLHQAKLDSIFVPESQVLMQVEMRINYFISQIGSKEKLEEYFSKPYSQIREDMKTMVRDQSTVQEMQKKLVGSVKVTPSEVRRYFTRLPEDSIPFIPTQVQVQILQLEPKVPQTEVDEIKNRLREYSDRVNNGESQFSTLATLYSEDTESARRGGELGFMGKGQLVPEFANVAFNLTDPKRVSRLVESEFGFHIIQLIEKRGDRLNCRHILLRPKISEVEKKASLAKMDSIRTDIVENKFSFEEGVAFISQDKETRNSQGVMVNPMTGASRFEMQQLPPEMARVIETMQVGEISKPIAMMTNSQKEVVVIARLMNRVEGHKANPSDDYQELKEIVEDSRRQEILDKWILKKQQETYVRIKEEYRNCDFEYPGWVKQ